MVRYHDDSAAPRSWGGPRVVVAGGPPGAFVGPTEVFVGDRVVRHRSGDLRVVRPFHFHSLYRWPTAYATFRDRRSGAMIDWSEAVRLQYGIDPTADATQTACDGWGWACEFVVDPVKGVMVCAITVPLADEDLEQLGVGTTLDEAACRALVQLPHEPPAD